MKVKAMARYNEKRIPYPKQDRLMDAFCGMLVSLKSKRAVKDFLKDLLNRQERVMIVRRLLIAQMLLRGCTYQEIIQTLHCGSPTIARVERWLHFGRGGFKKALSSLIIK